MTQHDIPETVQHYISVAIQTETVDTMSLYALACRFGTDFLGLVEEINQYAFVSRHYAPEAHTLVVRAAEKVWQELL